MGQSMATVRGPRAGRATASPTGRRPSRVSLQLRCSLLRGVHAIFHLPIEHCGMRIAAQLVVASARHGFRWQAEEVA